MSVDLMLYSICCGKGSRWESISFPQIDLGNRSRSARHCIPTISIFQPDDSSCEIGFRVPKWSIGIPSDSSPLALSDMLYDVVNGYMVSIIKDVGGHGGHAFPG